MADTNIAVNTAQCIKTINHYGYDVVYNICTNTQITMPWGGPAWLGEIAATIGIMILLGLGIALIMFFVMMTIKS